MEDEALVAAPDDDGARLAWAAAQGGPRAELVEIQCALAGGDERADLRAREQELLAMHGGEWAAPIVFALGAHRWRFSRGFVEEIEVTAARLLRRIDALPRTLVTRVRVTELDGRLAELLAQAPLAGLRALDLRANGLTSQDVARLAEASLPLLRALDLSCNDIDDRGAERLALASGLVRLERLGLAANVVETEGARALARARPPLVDLDLSQYPFADHATGNVIGPAAVATLCSRRWRRLALSGNPVDNSGAAALASAALGLRVLGLADARIGPSGAWSLAASPHLADLVALDLGDNPLGDEGATALESSPFLPRGLEIRVASCQLSDDARTALAARFARVVS
jgi:hypothetical protein